MLDTEKPDAVHIMTPHYLHSQMAIEALKRDVYVFLEKPMCIKDEDIEKIITAEKNSKAKICVSFQTRPCPFVHPTFQTRIAMLRHPANHPNPQTLNIRH